MDFNKALEIIQEGTNKAFKEGDIVKPTSGPHKGQKHEIIFDHGDGSYNIKPIGLKPKDIKYRLGAAKAKGSDLEKFIEEAVIMTPQQQKTLDQAKVLAKKQLLAKKRIKPSDDIEPEDVNDLKKGWKKIDRNLALKAKQMVGTNVKLNP